MSLSNKIDHTMKHIFFILLATFLFPNNCIGCSCLAPSSFCESITGSDGRINPEIILRGKIIGSSSEGKEIEVGQLIFGDIDQTEFILSLGLCTLYYQELEDGTEYVFALSKHNEKFYLINCAIGFLKIENEIVTGKIAPGIKQINYEQIFNLESCGDAFDQFDFKKDLKLFPNPTTDVIRVNNTSSKKTFENLQVRIFDSIGREIAKYTKMDSILPEEDWRINIQDFASGVYLVQISNRYQEVSYKIVKL